MVLWMTAAVVSSVLMEPWAAWVHRVLWHGPLWFVHRTHHTPRTGLFEWNDVFPVLHIPPALALILFGLWGPATWWLTDLCFGIGVGVSTYGVAYQVVHDGIVHRRLPLRFLERVPYIRALRIAHLRHHGRGGAPFGLFLGPWEPQRELEGS